jgi:hypothetical protein
LAHDPASIIILPGGANHLPAGLLGAERLSQIVQEVAGGHAGGVSAGGIWAAPNGFVTLQNLENAMVKPGHRQFNANDGYNDSGAVVHFLFLCGSVARTEEIPRQQGKPHQIERPGNHHQRRARRWNEKARQDVQ